ncbi:MAG: DUF4197 domain-containing protein [Pseudomonadota bacterium]|jgi:hypothetical protein
MQRRIVLSSVVALGGAGLAPWARAAVGFTSSEGTQALRVALEKGAQAAVSDLGRVDGFLGNDKVRIPLPSVLENAAPLLKTLGRGKQLEELQTTMNRAAEQAVPLALPLLKSAIKSMSVSDAQQILSGGDTSVTEFFAGKTREPLSVQFLPIVSKATERLSLTKRYNELAGKAAGMGLLKGDQANVQQYVTGKALDGLFLMIGEQEKKIRQDPVGTGSAILKKVFGSL